MYIYIYIYICMHKYVQADRDGGVHRQPDGHEQVHEPSNVMIVEYCSLILVLVLLLIIITIMTIIIVQNRNEHSYY